MASVQGQTQNPQNLNSESRISLASNSSRGNRLTRKRDFSDSHNRSRSKSKERYENQDFETYLKHLKSSVPSEGYIRTSLCQLPNPELKKVQSDSSNRSIGSRSDSNCSRGRTTENNENKNGHDRKKKREATPVKSRSLLQPVLKVDTMNENEKAEFELKIAGLEHELAQMKEQKEQAECEAAEMKSSNLHLKEVLSQLQIENRILLDEKRAYEQKIESLEKTILEDENNLMITQNNLNKLKQTIKENRMQELQTEMKKMALCNENLRKALKKNQNDRIANANELLQARKQIEELNKKLDFDALYRKESMRQDFLTRQVEKLKKQLSASKAEKETFLEQKVKEKDEESYRLYCENKNLKMQVHFLEHNKEKEVAELRAAKDSEIKKLRVKYSKLISEMKEKQEKQKGAKGRSGLNDRTHRDSITFQLSPDRKQE